MQRKDTFLQCMTIVNVYMSYINIYFMLYLMYTQQSFTFCNLIKSELSVFFMESTMNFIKKKWDMCDDFIKIGYVTYWKIIRLIVTTNYILLPYYMSKKRGSIRWNIFLWFIYPIHWNYGVDFSLCDTSVILHQEVVS